jgi:DNA-binding NarL/FixJ family response regulator
MCVEGLACVLGSFEDLEVVGRSFEWVEGVEHARALAPDVVIVDMAHCPECGPSAPLECVQALEGANVVVLSTGTSGPTIVEALEAGALGYLTLDSTDTAAVRTTVLAAARGEATLDPRVSAAVLARMRTLSRRAGPPGTRDVLPTERESEVLELLVKGLSNREIAAGLHVSESTVKNHLHAIYSKLGVESRSQAVSEAIKRGLASP